MYLKEKDNAEAQSTLRKRRGIAAEIFASTHLQEHASSTGDFNRCVRTFFVRTINEPLRLSANVGVAQKLKIEIEFTFIGGRLGSGSGGGSCGCGGCRGDIREGHWTMGLACLEEEWDPRGRSVEGRAGWTELMEVGRIWIFLCWW